MPRQSKTLSNWKVCDSAIFVMQLPFATILHGSKTSSAKASSYLKSKLLITLRIFAASKRTLLDFLSIPFPPQEQMVLSFTTSLNLKRARLLIPSLFIFVILEVNTEMVQQMSQELITLDNLTIMKRDASPEFFKAISLLTAVSSHLAQQVIFILLGVGTV